MTALRGLIVVSFNQWAIVGVVSAPAILTDVVLVLLVGLVSGVIGFAAVVTSMW